ncbi:unnamed protein product [Cuscuta europaea]|uniref:Tf2-1-like SH3-like domain-containing protein n=1 Tax=Cuscuta europaea TaxID=41803 RepID=A0A9P0YXU5_CUSEU|nr:unnamed protein product [Cuscuta europaea]
MILLPQVFWGVPSGYARCIVNPLVMGLSCSDVLRHLLNSLSQLLNSWGRMEDQVVLGPDYLQDTIEKVKTIQARMKAAQDRQKSYADLKRKPAEFEAGEKVLLRVSPTKGVMRFGKKGKLSPRFIGPYDILERVGRVAYRLALPTELAKVHNVFHISQLKKYVRDESHILSPEVRMMLSSDDCLHARERVRSRLSYTSHEISIYFSNTLLLLN